MIQIIKWISFYKIVKGNFFWEIYEFAITPPNHQGVDSDLQRLTLLPRMVTKENRFLTPSLNKWTSIDKMIK